MEKQSNLKKSILGVGLATVAILLIPLIAMQFTNEVDWTISDFIIMGILLFVTGCAYVLIFRVSSDFYFKVASAMAIGTTFLMIWANLAVGLIGSGPNPGNLMYIGVLGVVVIGIILSRFSPAGMERAMYGAAFALVLHTVIALAVNIHEYPGISVIEILGVNGFFGMLYVIAGVLFRNVSQTEYSGE